MNCLECPYYVGDVDVETDCYQPYCPFVDPEIIDVVYGD